MRGGIKSLAQINMEFEVDFTLNTYMRLSGALSFFLEKKENIPPAVPIGIATFLLSFDKGSRKIRKALSALAYKAELEKINSVLTFHNISNRKCNFINHSQYNMLLEFYETKKYGS